MPIIAITAMLMMTTTNPVNESRIEPQPSTPRVASIRAQPTGKSGFDYDSKLPMARLHGLPPDLNRVSRQGDASRSRTKSGRSCALGRATRHQAQ